MSFLLDVRANVVPEKERDLNTWYYTHVPRLVSIPGYVSGRRYVAISPGPKYAALYEIEDEDALPALLGDDESRRHPLTLSEWAEWDRALVPFMNHCSTNLYETDGGSRILCGDHPIVELRFDIDPTQELAACAEVDQVVRRLPMLEPDVVQATRLSAAETASTAWLGTKPCHLVLVQVAAEAVAADVARGTALRELLRLVSRCGTGLEVVSYRQIARHWPWFKEE